MDDNIGTQGSGPGRQENEREDPPESKSEHADYPQSQQRYDSQLHTDASGSQQPDSQELSIMQHGSFDAISYYSSHARVAIDHFNEAFGGGTLVRSTATENFFRKARNKHEGESTPRKMIRGLFSEDPRDISASEHRLCSFLSDSFTTEEVTGRPVVNVDRLIEVMDLFPPELMLRYIPLINNRIREDSRPGTSALCIRRLLCQWDLVRVLGERLSTKQEDYIRDALGQLLVITGSNGNFKCSTCLELVENFWGASGRAAVSLLSSAAAHVLDGKTYFKGSLWAPDLSPKPIIYAGTSSVLSVSLEAPQYKQPLLEAICWICSAVRSTADYILNGNSDDILTSQTFRRVVIGVTERNGLETFYLHKLAPLEPIEIDGTLSNCWNRLFKSVPVMNSVLDRPWGRGLEIPSALMMELAAVENVCTLSGQTALVGFHTVLLPTEREESTNSVQWHFLNVEPRQGPLLPIHVSSFMKSGWLKLDIETMKSMTCFLGWASEANIMLGTKQLVERQEKMRSCKSLDLGKVHLEKEQIQAVFQVSMGVTVADLIGQGGKTWRWTKDTIERTPSSEYQQALNETRRKTCLLIDSQTKQAWLVPFLSVLFHLCHRYYQINKRTGTDEQTPLPYLQATPNGDDAVVNAIENMHDLKVSSVCLSTLFHMLYLNLIQYPRFNCAEYVYANDMMDVVENTRSYPRKVPLNSNGYCWPDLLPFAEAAHAVAVCANVGQVLQVQQSLGDPLCQCTGPLLCYQLPKGRSYFAAHVSSLNRLWDTDIECQDAVYSGCEPSRRYRIFGSGASWTPQTDPWRSIQCRGTPVWAKKATANRVLQETSPDSLRKKLWNRQLNIQAFTSSKRNSHERGTPTPPLLGAIPENGVVVFGRYKDH